ncbi:hypothetical protein DYL61_12450 [Pseudomonas nabeulensis]|uniref:Site-specific integrase n=1 Tax=Pseudomonas nabeulensis TaxID=2293833 RepID=A0A4Z0B5P3_9PSED|nr:hypothetical protein [Pseudomonas nabeulensis]TFY93749.1 hypothetical protein DYL61_12450 [Pseudomonas nabeulensis]
MSLKIRWQHTPKISIAIPYDTEKKIIVNELMDYAIYLQREEILSHQYIKNEIFHLSLFYIHLRKRRLKFTQADTQTLRDFRDNDLSRLQQHSKATPKSLKAVVNNRLRRIYHFYSWLQLHLGLMNIIGLKNSQIYSSLPNHLGKSTYRLRDKNLFPLLYPRIGALSKHTTKYEPSEKNLRNLELAFLKHSNIYIAHRNALMLEIANATGFRRASINSLLCSQFNDDKINVTDEDFFVVSPPEQKYSNTLSYKIPLLLAFRINAFIKTFRKNFLQDKNIKDAITSDRIFLSARTGAPLNNQSISEIFAAAIKLINVPSTRVGIHAFRRKFTNDEIAKQSTIRAELKLDTSDASIKSAVSLSLGQSSPESINSYVSRRQTLEVHRRQNQKNREFEQVVLENQRLEKENENLRTKLKSLASFEDQKN